MLNNNKKYIAEQVLIDRDGNIIGVDIHGMEVPISYVNDGKLQVEMPSGSKTRGINPKCVRINDIDRIRTAYIFRGDNCVASISDEYCSLSGEHDWVIKPDYKVCDALAKRDKMFFMGGIPGIDIDLRKEEYIRNYTPVFVTQRIPSKSNEHTKIILKRIHLDSYDPFEIMCRTHGICGNNSLYVSRFKERTFTFEDREKLDIPDFDTSNYGWIINGKVTPYNLDKKRKARKLNLDYLK